MTGGRFLAKAKPGIPHKRSLSEGIIILGQFYILNDHSYEVWVKSSGQIRRYVLFFIELQNAGSLT